MWQYKKQLIKKIVVFFVFNNGLSLFNFIFFFLS